MTSISVSKDAFLGGRVRAYQPRSGYRAGVDAVILAAACPAKANETVLELGCGVGVAAMCLSARTGALVTGVEMQSDYAELALKNGVNVVEADLNALPAALRQCQFHHVIFNPPYLDPARGAAAADAGRQIARAEATPLSAWFEVAMKRLRPKGCLTMIHRAERLPEILRLLPAGIGGAEVLPLQPRKGRSAHLVLLRGRKDTRAPFRLHAPKPIHAAAQHEADRPDYTSEFKGILQDGAPLAFPD
ncbi:MAG: methyltransferase domain-containing protein [Pseudomonadota bacterium]